jgi:mannose-1-phosphate guanylyltransferase
MALIPVILSGGVGARLWPVSRELHPKPFMRLSDGQSLLQKAFLRAAALPDVAEVLTVTNRELYFKTEDEYRGVNDAVPASFILEPFGRNTAPAIAAAALYAAQAHGDDAVLLILPADHLIAKQDAFADAVATAVQLAREGSVVTFGIKPNAPETGFGYIETEGKHGVKRFVEKPDLERAKEYVSSGRYLWNAGMFCFSAGALLNELEMHAPDVLSAVRGCVAASEVAKKADSTQIELHGDSFRKAPDISIDYALMERSSRVAVVACDIGWSDIGSWSAVSDLVPGDENGNAALGEVLYHDSSNCYIQSEGRVAAAIGVKDVIVIDTPDALLVVDRARVQDVKHVVGQLKARSHDAYKVHREVHRPWGTYTVLEEGKRFKIKRIVVKPGASLSLQMHHHRSEHWIVVSGMAKVVNGEKEFFVNTNESTYIPAGHRHRLVNPGMIELVMIEVQSGEYLGEDDIVRFQDHYGRA